MADSAVSGIDFLVQVKISGVYTTIGGGRTDGLTRQTSNADATHKGSNRFALHVITRTNWGMTHDGVWLGDDTALQYLETQWYSKAFVDVRFLRADGTYNQGLASIANFSVNAPENDVVTFTMELTGTGALTSGTTS